MAKQTELPKDLLSAEIKESLGRRIHWFSRSYLKKPIEEWDTLPKDSKANILHFVNQILVVVYQPLLDEGARRERERLWSRLDEIDQLALDHKDFARRVCDLIVEIKPEALKGE